MNNVRFAAEDRYLFKESGTGADRESEREDRLLLRTQYSPIAPVVFQVELPFFLFRNHLDSTGTQDDSAHGLGDVTLGVRSELLRVGLDARHVVAVTGTLKMPTGANARHLPNAEPDEHLQLGTGSWDGLAGVSYAFGLRPWTLYANLTGRLNGANGRGFRYGHALFGTLGARRAFLEGGRLILSLEGQVRSAAKDRLADGSLDPDTGGQVYYATGSVAYAFGSALLLRGIVQTPIARALYGVQSEHPVAYLTVSYDWAL